MEGMTSIKNCVLFCFLFFTLANNGICDPEWLPVFIGFEQNGIPVYDSWTNPFLCNDLPPGKERHFRSRVIDHWTETDIKMVKVALFKKCSLVAWMTFNARNTSNLNWFSKENLYQSSFTDLSSSSNTNYFSTEGHTIHNRYSRRFYINQRYGGCPGDFGWFVVLDTPDVCDWAKSSKYPVFKYTTRGRNWTTDSTTADTLVISITTDL